MSDTLMIYCGPADTSGKRIVIAKLDTREHRDRFDVDNSFQRQKFRQHVIGKFGLDESAHEFIETEIVRAADAEDESPSQLFTPQVISMAAIQELQTDWFWDGYIPAGAITMLDGDPEEGKSQIVIDLAARSSRGDCMPPDSSPDGIYEPGNSLIIQGEDDPARTTKARLRAAARQHGTRSFPADAEVYRQRRRTISAIAAGHAVCRTGDRRQENQIHSDRCSIGVHRRKDFPE